MNTKIKNPELQSWLQARGAVQITFGVNKETGQKFTLYLVRDVPMVVFEDPRMPTEPWVFGSISTDPRTQSLTLMEADKYLGFPD